MIAKHVLLLLVIKVMLFIFLALKRLLNLDNTNGKYYNCYYYYYYY